MRYRGCCIGRGSYVHHCPERLAAVLLSCRISDKTALSDCSALRRGDFLWPSSCMICCCSRACCLRDRDRDRGRESALVTYRLTFNDAVDIWLRHWAGEYQHTIAASGGMTRLDRGTERHPCSLVSRRTEPDHSGSSSQRPLGLSSRSGLLAISQPSHQAGRSRQRPRLRLPEIRRPKRPRALAQPQFRRRYC
jgi:hypothetical protein